MTEPTPASIQATQPRSAPPLKRPGFWARYGVASLIVSLGLGAIATASIGWVVIHGVSTRDAPTKAEEVVARALRHLAVPAAERRRTNPIPAGAEVLAEGRAHWADHCATCHGNDGRGNTDMGRNLYPRAPDMTHPKTQRLSDGELFSIIKNGVRLTGMPAWGTPGSEGDAQTWKLVHFIRHLPEITPEELELMGSMNPVSPMRSNQEQEEDAFLAGEEAPDPSASHQLHNAHPRASRKKQP